MSFAPGLIRDSILGFIGAAGGEVTVREVAKAVSADLGEVPASSVRSCLRLNTPAQFERTERGCYRLRRDDDTPSVPRRFAMLAVGRAKLVHADCFDWLAAQPARSVHAVVTDPPYGLVEYSDKETGKLRAGRGGVWRMPPSFDGHQRAPLPRFTTLGDADLLNLHHFFCRFGAALARILVPGANVVVASNPLLAHIVAGAMAGSGLELRGTIARQVMTMRGGDRPKNAHDEFPGVSVMPRSQWEPWVVLRAPLDGRVQDNLRRWGTGGFRRPSAERPFGDLIRSSPTPASERRLAPHPSLKPQAFMRQIVHAALPLGTGVILDPFMGAGSTLAAANAVGYDSIGVERDSAFFELAGSSIPKLAALKIAVSPVVSA